MKNNIVLMASFLVLFSPLFAQVTEPEALLRAQKLDTIMGWKRGGIVSINLAQTSLTNWSAGGQPSLSVNGLMSLFANYSKNKSVWDNSLDIGYGLLRQGKGTDFMKTDDKIDFLSKYGQQAHENWYYSALFNFKTQMTEGKDYNSPDTAKISNLFAPAYLLGAVGMDYKPNAYFSVFIAPLTGKLTLVNDKELSDAGAFGVDPGKESKSEFGGYVRAIYSKNDFKQEILKDVVYHQNRFVFKLP